MDPITPEFGFAAPRVGDLMLVSGFIKTLKQNQVDDGDFIKVAGDLDDMWSLRVCGDAFRSFELPKSDVDDLLIQGGLITVERGCPIDVNFLKGISLEDACWLSELMGTLDYESDF